MTIHVHERGILPSIEGASLITAHVLAPYMRRWRNQWGATADEIQRALPCDELIPEPRWSSTRGITIAAPPEAVWPWLMQMGDGRGGLYSYQSLENLAGCKMNNRIEIVPELQGLKIGDGIKLHDKIPALPVIHLVPHRALVIGGPAVDGVGATWGWYLTPTGVGSTRLVERWRTVYPLTTAGRLGYGQLFVAPISFVMSRKMLLGIKARAEGLALTDRAQPVA